MKLPSVVNNMAVERREARERQIKRRQRERRERAFDQAIKAMEKWMHNANRFRAWRRPHRWNADAYESVRSHGHDVGEALVELREAMMIEAGEMEDDTVDTERHLFVVEGGK